MLKINRYLALSILLAALALLFPLEISAQSPVVSDVTQGNSGTYNYDSKAAYHLGSLIRLIARQIITEDLSRDLHIRAVQMRGHDNAEFLMHIYEHNGTVVEFRGDSLNPTIWKIHLPASVIPEYMSSKSYYLAKLSVIGFDLESNILSVETDGDRLIINFINDHVRDLNLQVNPGVD